MSAPFIFLSSRWFEPNEDATADDVRWTEKLSETLAERGVVKACEVTFAAKDETGAYGALVEIELDDGCEPSGEAIERLRKCITADGATRFHFVGAGSGVVFNGRAALWGFVPEIVATAERIEAAAAALFAFFERGEAAA